MKFCKKSFHGAEKYLKIVHDVLFYLPSVILTWYVMFLNA